MALWLTESTTVSQKVLKSSSSSDKDTASTKSADSYILEPDIVLGNVGRRFFPDDEIATNFLSLIAGHIIKSIESNDALRRISLRSSIRRAFTLDAKSSTEKGSMISVEVEKCAHKKRKEKRRYSSLYRASFSSRSPRESIFSKKRSPKSVSQASRHDLDRGTTGALDGTADKSGNPDELKRISEDDRIAQLLAGCAPNSYLSTYYMERKLHNWTFKEQDQIVEIVFKNGDRYYGRLSRMLMEGEGKYIWSNGLIYKGTFKQGNAHGSGALYWPDGSWYEGQMVCNKRQGHGMTHRITTSGSVNMIYHYGEYRFGKKHGKGVIVFGKNNYYDGEWKFGKRHGFGTRHYASGASYCGEWMNGMRSGHGTMIWPNNDVYTGEWKMGYMHGPGKYTWEAFRNTRFVAPQLNVFTGRFFEGRRLGFGHLELATGASIYTTWRNREKFGSGEIMCQNGNKLFARNLFYEDRAVDVDMSGAINYTLPEDATDDTELLNLMEESEIRERAKPRLIDANSPVHKMDLSSHINKLFEIDYDLSIPPSEGDPVCLVEEGQCQAIRELEAAWLEKIIMQRMADLTAVYSFYSTIGVENEMPEFKIVMLRIMLHQLLRDCGIKDTKYSAVEFDQMVGIGTDPFDKVLMYEMIHYLLTLCMLTRMKPRTLNKKIPGVLAATFDRFIDEVVLKSIDIYNGTFLKYLKCIPLQAIYKLYKNFENPLRIKDLCCRLLNPHDTFSDKMPFTTDYFLYSLQGNNTVFADGSFGYVPFEEPFFDFKKESLKFEEIPQADFSVFADLGFENIIRSIAEVVPEAIIANNGELDGDYMLSFLDFCDILVNLATLYLDLCESFYKAMHQEDPGMVADHADTKIRPSKISHKSSTKYSKLMQESVVDIDNFKTSAKATIPGNKWLPKKKETMDLETFG